MAEVLARISEPIFDQQRRKYRAQACGAPSVSATTVLLCEGRATGQVPPLIAQLPQGLSRLLLPEHFRF